MKTQKQYFLHNMKSAYFPINRRILRERKRERECKMERETKIEKRETARER